MLDTRYKELVEYYEANKHLPWNEWLVFDRVLEKHGKQGQVGIFRSKEGNLVYLFKTSQSIDFLVYHELTSMRGLNSLCAYCPHFCKGIGVISAMIEPDGYVKNPFRIKSKYPIEKEVLLCEYIPKSTKLSNYVRADKAKISEDVLYSLAKQVMLGLVIAQNIAKFTHYDLHSDNIMVRKCNPNLVFLYKLDEQNQFLVPTLGYYPVIIDFGFSYAENAENGPLWSSLGYTDSGFLSDRFDWVADPKLFLITLSEEIRHKRNTKKSKTFRRVVQNMFHPLSVDMSCGWDTHCSDSALDIVWDTMGTTEAGKSKVFRNNPTLCLEILQTLIIAPIQPQKTDMLKTSFQTFLNEWLKIEMEISSEFYGIYLLKKMVDTAREVRSAYTDKTTREAALKAFRLSLTEAVDNISSYCTLKDIHYERLLCGLYIFTKNMEGVLHTHMMERVTEKKVEYDKLPLKSTLQMYCALEVNLPCSNYIYNTDTVFVVLDCVKKNYSLFQLEDADSLTKLNSVPGIYAGTLAYDMYCESNSQ